MFNESFNVNALLDGAVCHLVAPQLHQKAYVLGSDSYFISIILFVEVNFPAWMR